MTAENSNSKKLVLLDAMALVYRAHFALIRSPRFTRNGQCTSAVFGLANTLLDLVNREHPTHLAAAFDTAEPTDRHVVYPEYKAHRDEMPEDLSSQLPLVDRLMDAFNVPIIRQPGYEADDIIGTLSHQATAKGFHVLMVTPDKDYDQLVTTAAQIWKPGRQGNSAELFGVSEVLQKWEVERIEQVVDILSLMGDSSDNIPGVPGIGPKTATKLIQQFGSLENLLASTSALKGKQKDRLEAFADQARLSKRLVTIQLDVPHSVSLDNLAWSGFDFVKLRQLFQDLEFETLGKRLFGENFSTRQNLSSGSAAPTVADNASAVRESTAQLDHRLRSYQADQVCYQIVRSQGELGPLVARLLSCTQFCFDTETTGLDPRLARLLGIAVSISPNEAYYIVCPFASAARTEEQLQTGGLFQAELDLGGEACSTNPTAELETQAILDQLRPVFESTSIAKIGHNLKYDMTVLKWHGIQVQGPILDTMLAHVIAEPEGDHGLDLLARSYLAYETIPIEQLIGPKGPDQRNMASVPVEIVGPYACEDADITLQLAHKLLPEIDRRGLHDVCYEVEFPLISVLVDMEANGIRLDRDAIGKFSKQLEIEIAELEQKIYQTAGRRFNIDSPKQLGVVLYHELQIEENPKKTATGQFSTRESELERLSGRHPIIADILDYRNATKLKRTYVDQLPDCVDRRTGRVHTVYSQAWTATGRMQSINPNLQTIPIRKERGREIRAAFVPRDENYLILSADYSQIELRVMAELSGDPAMLEAFQQNIDIHSVTASKVFGVPVGLVTREMRAKAKMVNFGIIYGISSFGLQQRLNIPRAEATELIDSYFVEYPKVQEYIQTTIDFARKHGYVQTMTGRRRYLRDINSRSRNAAAAAERLAMNSPIQGTAADILKLAMIRVHRELGSGGFRTKMLLTVHDEIVFDMHKEETEQVIPLIKTAMSTAFPMKVPLVVDVGFGDNWLAAQT